jgi:hypothetical protein
VEPVTAALTTEAPRWTTDAAAAAFLDAGCSVLRVRADGSKAPVGSWETAQQTAAGREAVDGWFLGGHPGIGVVTGAVSGNLEMLEFEGRAIAENVHGQLQELAEASGLGELWHRVATGYRELTPSGGVHLLFRVAGAPVQGNRKLARRPSTPQELREHQVVEVARARRQHADDPEVLQRRLSTIAALTCEKVPQVLIETRGEGGFVVVAPSGGPTHPNGKPWTLDCGGPSSIPMITAAEYRALHDLARALDVLPRREVHAPRTMPVGSQPSAERPGDRFNRLASWDDLLVPHGWQPLFQRGDERYWRRPGKSEGISATTGRNDHDRLYVFSTSTEFEANRPYDKLGALALLEHGGDIAAAARSLAADPRYGTVSGQPKATTQPAVSDRDTTPALTPSTPDFDTFWERPSLRQVHDFARARRTSPWAVLGVALVRAVVATKPFVMLPALVGSEASLNLFVALVGPSGSGKGAAAAVAEDALDVGDITERHVGSGEGIPHLFAHREKGAVVRDRDAVLLNVPEVDNLTALGSRQGSTLLPVLRSAWSGERLGFANADPSRTLPIERHSYRLGLVLGVQPSRAGALLDDADGGTPQRFLWLPTTDPQAPDVCPPIPATRRLSHRPWQADSRGRHVVDVPQAARDRVDQVALERARGTGDPLDGHALLCRLKAAQALALLDDRQAMTDDDWRLSGVLMAVSSHTRSAVKQQLIQANEQANLARGRADGLRLAAAEETTYERDVTRVCRSVTRYLDRHPNTARGDVRKALPSRDRKHFDDALARLRDAGQVTESTTEHGARLSLANGTRT